MSQKSTRPKDWWAEFTKEHPVPSGSIDYFRTIEWTNKHLSNPAYDSISAFSRTLKSDGEDYFFAETVNNDNTIPHYICLQLRNFVTPPTTKAIPDQTTPVIQKHPSIAPEHADCIFLLKIGAKGLDGHPTVMHGGMSCAILDETMGFCIVMHLHNIEGAERKNRAFTVNLNTTYRAPVSTPGELIVKTWMTKREGRKWTAKGQIIDKNGKVCTEAEGVWVMVPIQKL